MNKPKISKKVHNAFVNDYKLYKQLFDFNFNRVLEANESKDEVMAGIYDSYCDMYMVKMITLESLYKKLTGERLEDKIYDNISKRVIINKVK